MQSFLASGSSPRIRAIAVGGTLVDLDDWREFRSDVNQIYERVIPNPPESKALLYVNDPQFSGQSSRRTPRRSCCFMAWPMIVPRFDNQSQCRSDCTNSTTRTSWCSSVVGVTDWESSRLTLTSLSSRGSSDIWFTVSDCLALHWIASIPSEMKFRVAVHFAATKSLASVSTLVDQIV
jgi:hypothetical protein